MMLPSFEKLGNTVGWRNAPLLKIEDNLETWRVEGRSGAAAGRFQKVDFFASKIKRKKEKIQCKKLKKNRNGVPWRGQPRGSINNS